ncbi:hypothetical protein HT136_08525 [Novosphingobium profundi]|uniref:hypothetical protein n=1 Tax=Novosphingobium profundi TaxID=1774954 RepID=UPI001BDA2748|nr:hypothetical protein [Novosphingobium profundi]MBT0668413.1 hypothetical protein [Novosphingobium profundi]
MTTNINSTNPVNALVKSFQESIPANLEKQREFQVHGLRELWKQVAEAFLIALKILQLDKAQLKSALKERNISEAKSGANEFLPIVKLLYGEWKDEDQTIFEPNRSAEKYACVFRYFYKRKDKFADARSIVDHIEETEGNLKGIEQKDRAENKKTTAKVSSDDELKRGLSVRSAMEIGSLEKVREAVLDLPDNAQQGQLWFKVENGKVYLMGYRTLEDGTRDTLAKKRGKAIINAAQNAATNAELAEIE